MGRDFQGIVLSGGKSSRFGEDKALAVLNGLTFLETAVGRLRELGLNVTVITNRARDYSGLNLGCDIQRDMIEEKGPLGGLYTACHLFPDQALLVVVCDMPSMSVSLLERLIRSHRRENSATVFSFEKGGLEPFPGVYESNLFQRVLERLKLNKLSLEGFLDDIPELNVIQLKLAREAFMNINNKKDLDQLKTPVTIRSRCA